LALGLFRYKLLVSNYKLLVLKYKLLVLDYKLLVLYLKLLRLLPSSLSPFILVFLAMAWTALGSGRCRRLVRRRFCPFWALRFWETVCRECRLWTVLVEKELTARPQQGE
jgi:hypothetical protein